MDGVNLADFKTVMDDNGTWGGGGFVWFIIIALIFGGGGLFGGGRQAATTDELSAGFNFAGVNGKLNELVAGQANVNQNLGNAICTSTYELASKIDNCCCNTQLGIQQVRYDMAVQNKDLAAAIHAEAEATRNMITQNENANLRQQLNFAQMQNLTCGIPRVNNNAWGVYAYPTCQPCGTVM